MRPKRDASAIEDGELQGLVLVDELEANVSEKNFLARSWSDTCPVPIRNFPTPGSAMASTHRGSAYAVLSPLS